VVVVDASRHAIACHKRNASESESWNFDSFLTLTLQSGPEEGRGFQSPTARPKLS
jgi:hypothetical protein